MKGSEEMSLPDVHITIEDGGLGILPPSNAGLQAKVGVCSIGNPNQIITLSDPSQIVAALGTGPLVDACFDSFGAGASTIYAVPATADIAGSIGAITTNTKTGTGNITVSGNPLDNYQVIISIMDAGNLNTATFEYSLDGGDTYSQKTTVPSAGSYPIANTGLTLTFTAGTGTSFASGDEYTFTATAPSPSISSIDAAIEVLFNSNLQYEFIHIVTPTDNTVWAALDSMALEAEQNYRYIHFVTECRGLNAGETVDDWVTAILALGANFASTRVSICAGRALITDNNTGLVVDRNGVGIYTGWVSYIPIQSSPGKVELGSLPSISALKPDGINYGHITSLDQAGFITFRQYIGYNGFYITNGRIKAEPTSDFQYVETRRVMDQICRNSRMAALKFMQGELEINTDGTIKPNSLSNMEANLQAPLDQMVLDKQVSSGSITIPLNQNVLSTSKLQVKIRAIPIGIMREIDLDIGYTNPAISGQS